MSSPHAVRAATVVPVRRKRPGAAGAAYSHALAVLRRPSEATIVARSALRRGAHSRTAVMAHARYGALEQAHEPTVTDLSDLASDDIRELAWQLAGTRPAIERSLVDLELRYGFSPALFARILGISVPRAKERSQQISVAWTEVLDSAMVAWLGPGSCADLGGILTAAGMTSTMADPATEQSVEPGNEPEVSAARPVTEGGAKPTIGALLDVATEVYSHAEACAMCSERMAQLTSVRALVGSRPLETVPTAVVGTARESKHRIAGPLPPSIEPRRLDFRRLAATGAYVGIALALVGVGLFVGTALTDGDDSQEERVARLVQDQPIAPLLATPTIVSGNDSLITLANNSAQPLRWNATSSAEWLSIEPSQGVIAPTSSVALKVRTAPGPAGSSASIRFAGGSDGEQVVRYEADGG